MTDSQGTEVAVVGSVNRDLVVPVEWAPQPGETVLGGAYVEHRGGKGANQAVGCARLGRSTAFIGCVGTDEAGAWLRDGLQLDGIDTSGLARDDRQPSGLAVVSVAADGESTIVVSPGANSLVDTALVERSADILRSARVVLTQLEIPLEGVEAACRTAQGLVVLNPAPARALPDQLMRRADVLVPNRSELFGMLGQEARAPEALTFEDVRAAALRLGQWADCVVTLGADGALVVADERTTHVPARSVEAVDATAAGDAFCAGLADALVEGADLVEAAGWATSVSAVTVTRRGAQPSLPTRAEVRAQADASTA